MISKSKHRITKKVAKKSAIKSNTTRKKVARKKAVGKRRIIRGDIEYVLPLGNGWVVKNNSAKRFTTITDSKRDAINIARELARRHNNALIVHGRSGKIEIREKY